MRTANAPALSLLASLVALSSPGLACRDESRDDRETRPSPMPEPSAPADSAMDPQPDPPPQRSDAAPSPSAKPLEESDTRALERGIERVDESAQRIVEPSEADPEDIERYQTFLAQRIAADRADAKRGDLLTPELTEFLYATFQEILKSEDGAPVLATLREAEPREIVLEVNGAYPADAVLATTPPAVLERFPPLPEGIEYRFANCQLMLLARDARLILDYTDRCFW